jgi:hypothetical protein
MIYRATIVLVILCAEFWALPAFAIGSTCAAATPLIADGRLLTLDYLAPVSSGFYLMQLDANRSYSLEIRDNLDSSNIDLTITLMNSSCSTSISTGTTHTESMEPIEPSGGWRLTYIPTTSGTYVIQVQNTNPSIGRYVSASVTETTIYNTVWSSIGASSANYNLFNTTSSTISYTLSLTATIGGTQTYTATGSLTPMSLVIIGAPSVSLPTTGMAGFAILTHNGPPGAIQPECLLLYSPSGTLTTERDSPCSMRR